MTTVPLESLSDAEIKQLQTQLRNNKDLLVEQLANNAEASAVVTLDQTSVGRLSRMDAIQQQSMALTTRQQATKKLQKIAAALRRIDDDDYGYCHECDKPIGFRRLQVQAESLLCLSCQSKKDAA